MFFAWVIIGGGVLFFLANKLINDGQIPTWQKYSADNPIATSTDLENSLKELLATSTELTTSSTSSTTNSNQLISTTTQSIAESAEFLASSLSRTTIKTASSSIIALIADNDVTQEKGLGGFKALGDKEGMLFVFETPEVQGFWMKDTLIPLDMIWIDENKNVVGVSANILPSTFPEIFYSPSPVKYVLEINAGSAKKLGIASSTKLQFVPASH